MTDLNKKIEELKNLGFSKEQTEEILQMGEEEVLERVLDDFTVNAQEDVVDSYIQKVEQAKNNSKKLATLFDEIMSILYGENNANVKKEEFLVEYIKGVIDLTHETKNLCEKYNQGDSEAVKKVEEAQKDPNTQDIIKKAQEIKNQEDKG